MDKTAYFEQLRQKRRSDILTAAKAMILQQGMDNFNIQQLARELDISTVTLYKYFKNSEDIMLALQEQILLLWQPSSCKYNSDENPLTVFLNFHKTLYRNIFKYRENVTLLALFEVYLRSKPQSETSQLSISTYPAQITDYLHGLLVEAQTRNLIADSISVGDALDFIIRLNLAQIQQIGLMKDDTFKQEEKNIRRHIEQMLDLFILYLENGGKGKNKLD